MALRVACIGECMVELRESADGVLVRSHGGDTLNTAVYLARLGVGVDYLTALGDDGWSQEMLDQWQNEGIGTALVRRVAGQLPGLYVIQTDPLGERRFLYWRDSAPARRMFDPPYAPALLAALADYSLLYLSGITLSILDDPGRRTLFAALDVVRAKGARVAFDANVRPRGWPDRAAAAALFREAFARSDFVFASLEDLGHLFGADGAAELAQHAAGAERILKLDRPAVQVTQGDVVVLVDAVPAARVVDTTAAGDSFAAAYLAARLAGQDIADAARAGHRLAGAVVGYSGAIIPRSAMPNPEPQS